MANAGSCHLRVATKVCIMQKYTVVVVVVVVVVVHSSIA